MTTQAARPAKQHIENSLTKGATMKINYAKLGFVLAAALSFLFSVYLWFSGSREEGLFVGLWVPSILAFGGLVMAGRMRRG